MAHACWANATARTAIAAAALDVEPDFSNRRRGILQAGETKASELYCVGSSRRKLQARRPSLATK
jgi:hypothetical protein